MARRATIAALLISLTLSLASAAVTVNEVEPNNSPETANELRPAQVMVGAIAPIGDVDLYRLPGINTTWGVIALVDTSGASGSRTARLTVLGDDGTTVLRRDVGSWERGSGIALQPFTGHQTPLYLEVNEEGNNATISTYALRYYETVTNAQPEIEPNDDLATGTPSSFTHTGAIGTPGDRDCYAFHGREGDRIIIALTTEGAPLNAMLELEGPGGVLESANFTEIAGQEFLEYGGLPVEGVYAYCVRPGDFSATGPSATYRVGLVRNGGLYFPDWRHGVTWQNRPPEGFARPGDELRFDVAITNTSPITIPGTIDLGLTFPSECLSLVAAHPAATDTYTGTLSWRGQRTTGLAPGEVYSTIAHLRADAACVANVSMSVALDYYVTGTGGSTRAPIYDRFLHLPVALR